MQGPVNSRSTSEPAILFSSPRNSGISLKKRILLYRYLTLMTNICLFLESFITVSYIEIWTRVLLGTNKP